MPLGSLVSTYEEYQTRPGTKRDCCQGISHRGAGGMCCKMYVLPVSLPNRQLKGSSARGKLG